MHSDSTHISALVAPAHYQVDPTFGSEFLWSWELSRRIAERVDDFRCVAGTARDDVVKDAGARQVWSKNEVLTYPKRLQFAYQVAREGRRLIAEKPVNVLHHMLPFAIGVTFNLLALGRQPPGRAFVIGPIQSPLVEHSTLEDERAVLNRVFDRQIKTPPSERVMRLALPAVRALSHATMRRAQVLVAVSRRAQELCLEAVPNADVVIVPPGTDTTRFVPLEFESRRHEIIMVNYLVKRKRVHLVIDVLVELRNRGLTPTLRIFGEGPEKDSLRTLVDRVGLRDQVVFEGLVENADLPEHYRSASVFCLVSEAEGAATVPLEAMASGLPVVATDAGIMGDVLRANDVGVLVEPSPSSIASALIKLFEDADRRRVVSQNARLLAERDYEWNVIADRYVEIYRDALAKVAASSHEICDE